MKIPAAGPIDIDVTATVVVLERHVHWLVDVTDPMSNALCKPQLVHLVASRWQIGHVVGDGSHYALACARAGCAALDLRGRARYIDVVLLGTGSGMIRPGTGLAERAKLGVKIDERGKSVSSLRV